MAKVCITHPDDIEAANALRQGVPPNKCAGLKFVKGMEGERKGMPHLSPRSSRYMNAHRALGTNVKGGEYGP